MIKSADLNSIAGIVAEHTSAEAFEVIYSGGEQNLTRFAVNAITQNVNKEFSSILIKVFRDRRVGIATINQTDKESIVKALERAEDVLDSVKEETVYLPPEKGEGFRVLDAFFRDTAEISYAEKAGIVKKAVELASGKGIRASGIFENEASQVGYASSAGACLLQDFTSAVFSMTSEASDSSGWAEGARENVRDIDFDALAALSIERALASAAPVSAEKGRYTVILEPAAVSDFLFFMSVMGFGAEEFSEGKSFMSGKIGKKIFSDKVTIIDDAYDNVVRGMYFDFEGMPRQKTILVENGVAKSVVYDRRTAGKSGAVTTGHCLPPLSQHGPIPINIMMMPGENTLPELISGTDRGILVTRLHYTNVIDPLNLFITGMTRDGTFMIENGKVTRPVKNMRFTQNVIELFNSISGVSGDRVFAKAFFGGGFTVPALKVDNFNFSSTTEF